MPTWSGGVSWTPLPEEEYEYGGKIIMTRYAAVMTNNIGSSISNFANLAFGVNADLETDIDNMKSEFDSAVNALSLTYSATLSNQSYSAQTSSAAAPDYSSNFVSTITLPSAPTTAAAPTLTDPEPSFPTAPTAGTTPTPDAAPTLATIVAAFPSTLTLPTVPTFDAAPTLGALAGMETAPTAPSVGGLMEAAAYTAAYALAEADTYAAETVDAWEMAHGAASGGIGMPYAAGMAMQAAARQKRAEALGKVALDLSRQKAADTRDDLKWSYETRLKYWSVAESASVARWQTEQTVKMGAWVQKVAGQLDQYGKVAVALLEQFGQLSENEARRITAGIANESFKLKSWMEKSATALELWSKPLEVKASIYSAATQGESERVSSIVGYQKLLVDAWAKEVDTEISEYQALSGTAISKQQASAQILAQRFQSETQRLGALVENLRTGLLAEAERRQWWSTGETLKLDDAKARAADAREMQKILVDAADKAIFAVAGARAEQLKALVSAMDWSLSATARADGEHFETTVV